MLHPNRQVAFLVIFTCLKNIHDMHLSVVSLRNFLAKNKQEKRVWCEIHHVIFFIMQIEFYAWRFEKLWDFNRFLIAKRTPVQLNDKELQK